MGRKKKVEENTSKYSSYWFDDDDYTVSSYYGRVGRGTSFDIYDSDDDDDDKDPYKISDKEWEKQEAEYLKRAERMVELIKLGAFRRSCANFVRILTGQDIPVKYNDGDNSYTDGKEVVLSAKVENNFDSTVGLALHEGSHIVLTDFEFLSNLIEDYKFRRQFITDNMIQTIIKLNPKIKEFNWGSLFRSGKKYPNFASSASDAHRAADMWLLIQFKDILNWIEDRRIDNYVYSSAPGYRGYYEALYNRYFFSDEVTKSLKDNDMFKEETFDSYMYRLINMLNPANDMSCLKGMQKIKDDIDVTHINRLKSTTDVANLSLKVLSTIVSNITSLDYTLSQMQEWGFGDGDGGADGMTIDINSLTDEQCKEMFGINKKKLEKLLKRLQEQREFLRGDISKKKLSKTDAKAMNSLASAGVTLEMAGGEEFNGQFVKVLVIEKLSDAVMEADEFNCMFKDREWIYEGDYEAMNKGFVLGKMLGRRLQVRNEERTLKYTRQDNGRIDKRLIASLGYDAENVFSRIEVNKYERAHIHISVDASGSMNGQRFYNAVKTAVAIAVASRMVKNIDCVISFRGTTHEFPLVCVAYDSRVNGLGHIRKYFPLIHSGGTTPESLCFEAIMDKVFPKMSAGENFYFVNLSDGEPAFSSRSRVGGQSFSYYGEPAYRHCRRMVGKMIRNFGATIISYFINDWRDDLSAFRRMYGNDNVFNINTDSVDQIAHTMNRKFLNKNTRNENLMSM